MKTLSLALVLLQAIAIVLVGCSRTKPEHQNTIPSPTPAPTPTVPIAPTSPSTASVKARPTVSQVLKQIKFICSEFNGYPATMAKISRGSIPIFLWESEYFTPSGYDPKTRCKQVSGRLQKYHTEDLLHYIGIDYMNNYPILCVADAPGNCLTNSNGEPLLLVTLEPQHDPNKELENVLRVRDRATEPITYLIDKGVAKYDNEGDLFLNLKKYAEELLIPFLYENGMY